MLAKYLFIARVALIQGIKNYKALLGLSIFLVTCLIIFAHLWTVAAAKGGFAIPAESLLWYIAYNEWVLIAVPEIYMDIEQDLRSGRLAYLLPRPLSYIGAKFAEGFGALLLNLIVLGAVSFTFAWFWVGSLPFSSLAFAISLGLGVLAGCVALLFQMAIGLSTFWLREVGPFYWIWEKLLFVMGGLILPLVAYPLWLQKIAFWTPFPVLLGERSALAIQFEASHAWWLFAVLIAWLLVGALLVRTLYYQGLKILNVEGG